MTPINKEYLKNYQYRDAGNLAARRDLFRYGTNPESLWHWVARQYVIHPGSKILEVGCGSGEFWREAVKVFPNNCDIILTDLSQGMLEGIKKTVNYIPNCKFEIADVEKLLYKDKSFNVVLAHLMLYHADSPADALKEIKRVLTGSGFAGILLSNENNMQPLFTLLNCENPRQAKRFSTEIAGDVLQAYFSNIQHSGYLNILEINEVEPIIAYLSSLSGMNEKDEAFYSRCRNILTDYIAKHGFISLPTSRDLFIVS